MSTCSSPTAPPPQRTSPAGAKATSPGYTQRTLEPEPNPGPPPPKANPRHTGGAGHPGSTSQLPRVQVCFSGKYKSHCLPFKERPSYMLDMVGMKQSLALMEDGAKEAVPTAERPWWGHGSMPL